MNKSFSESFLNFKAVNWTLILDAFYDTIYMTFLSSFLVGIFGSLLGLILYTLRKKKGLIAAFFYGIISIISNIFRSTPFMVLMVLLIPFTNYLLGTFLGSKAAIPPLVLSATPFYARLVEMSFREVDSGVLKAATSMGASYWQIIYKVLVPESIPTLISGIILTMITMVGYTTMAGFIGAGGLGSIAWQEGFQRGNYTVTLISTIIILIFVFILQALSDLLTNLTDKRRK